MEIINSSHPAPLFPFSTASKKYQYFKAIAFVQPPFVNHFFIFHNPKTADVTNDIIPQNASIK